MEVQLKRPTPGNASPASQVIGGGKSDLLQAHDTVMISCKGVPGKSLTVVGDVAVGFAATDAKDDKQQWIKVADPVRKDAFAIVNKAAGNKAIQIPIAANLPVRLATIDRNAIDKSLLWTADAVGAYSIIHEFVDKSLVLDAVHIVLEAVHMVDVSNQHGSDNQLWKLEQRKA